MPWSLGSPPESAAMHMQIFVGRCQDGVYAGGVTGDELLKVLATLANPHRLRVVAALTDERNYVSALARDLGISRALLQVHLRKLESAGLVKSSVEVSDDGKAMKFYEVAPFALYLTPDVVAAAARTLSAGGDSADTDIAGSGNAGQGMEAGLR
jgi:DNA-binding transcriptional ArsR family regulator